MYRHSILDGDIQFGILTIPASGNHVEVALGVAVDPDRSFVEFGDTTGDGGAIQNNIQYVGTVRLTLIGGGVTIRADHGGVGVLDDLKVPYRVVQLRRGVLAGPVQRGEITIAVGDLTKDSAALAPSVDPDKSYIPWAGASETSTNSCGDLQSKYKVSMRLLDDGSAVRLERKTAGTYSWTIPYQVVPFK